MPTASGVPRPHARRVRAAPGPDPPDSSRCRIKGVSHAGSSRTPLRPAYRTRTIWQYWHVPALSGLLPPSPAPPGSGCPQLRRPAATGSAVKVSHLHSNHCASRRTNDLRHSTATLLLEQGVELVVIKELLGHAHIGVTAGVYTYASASSATPSTPSAPCSATRQAPRRPTATAMNRRPAPPSSADVAVNYCRQTPDGPLPKLRKGPIGLPRQAIQNSARNSISERSRTFEQMDSIEFL